MTPTPKWNEELPLRPRAPLPPPRRYEIEVDGRRTNVVVRRTHAPESPPGPRLEKSNYEITGAGLREDELIEYAADTSKGELIVDGRGNIIRPGEHIPSSQIRNRIMGQAFFPPTYIGEHVPSYRSGVVVSREKLRDLVRSGRLKKPRNLVNSFPSDRLRRRKQPFDPKLERQAAALVHPGAYQGLVISPRSRVSATVLGPAMAAGTAVIGADGSVYMRDEVGVLKKIGKVVKKGAKVVAKPVAKVAKPVAKVATTVARPVAKATVKVAKVAKPLAKPIALAVVAPAAAATLVTAKLAGKAAAAALRPFLRPSALKKAQLIAKSKGRAQPNQEDRREGGKWVVANMLASKNLVVKGAGKLMASQGGLVAGMGAAPAAALSVPAMIAAIKAALIPLLTAALAKEAKRIAASASARLTAAPPPEPVAPPEPPYMQPAAVPTYEEAAYYEEEPVEYAEMEEEVSGLPPFIAFGCAGGRR